MGVLTVLIAASIVVAFTVRGHPDAIPLGFLLVMTSAGLALLYGLPALLAAMMLAFFGARHVLERPMAFAAICASLGAVPLALSGFPPSADTLELAVLTLPGVAVSFALLARSFERITSERARGLESDLRSVRR